MAPYTPRSKLVVSDSYLVSKFIRLYYIINEIERKCNAKA